MKFLSLFFAILFTFTLNATEFYFIRHGQSEINANRALIGGEHPMIELTELGKNQAKAAGKRFEETAFDAYYTSDTVRTLQTARYFCDGQKVQPLEIQRDHRITEKSNGDWEGKLRKKLYTPETLTLRKQWNFRPGDKIKGESAEQVTKRMITWVNETAKLHPNKRLVVFSHAYAIRCLVLHALNLGWDTSKSYGIENTSVTIIHSDGNQISCSKINDTSHLNSQT